jgi:transketolase
MTSELLSYKARLTVLEMINKSKASHIGSAFSISDLVASIYNDYIFSNNNNSNHFILSKGHAGSIVYAVLSELNKIDRSFLIDNYYQDGSIFSGHISHEKINGIEFSTGSLGHGIGYAAGIALHQKIRNIPGTTFVIVGDGELNEGSIWEAFLFASQFRLKNLKIIIDLNGFQGLGKTKDILFIPNLLQTINSIGLMVSTINGHNQNEILESLNFNSDTAHVIIANTINGKVVSFIENDNLWHYKDPQLDFFQKAKEELINQINLLSNEK